MSEQETPSGLSKWQLGLLIGIPVAVVGVAGILWYLNSVDDSDENEDDEGAKSPQTSSPKAEEAKDETDNMVLMANVVKLLRSRFIMNDLCAYLV